MTSRSAATLRLILGRSLLTTAALVASLAAAEFAVRFAAADTHSPMVKDPRLGQRYRPLLHRTVYEEESDRHVELRVNSLGFRDREHSAAAPEGVERIVMLGDSFLVGMSVDFDQTFAQVCERLLNAGARRVAWEVVNLGVAGYGTAQEMLAYEEVGRRFRPRIVVLNFFAGNDVSDNSPELSTSPRPYFTLLDGHLVGRWPSESRRRVTEWLNEHSRLYTWQKTQTQKIERFVKRSVVVNPVHRVFNADPDDVLARAWAVTEALILRLQKETMADGARLFVSYIPFADEVNPDWWDETVKESPALRAITWDFNRPSERLARFCAKHGIAFGSPREIFERHSPDTRYFFKHGHFNVAGHQIYARYLAASIQRLSGSLNAGSAGVP